MKWEWHKDKSIKLLDDQNEKRGIIRRKFERDSKTGVRHAMWVATIEKQAVYDYPTHVPQYQHSLKRLSKFFGEEVKKFHNLTDAKEWMLSSLVARKLEHGL